MKRTLVVGVGNPHRGDDAVGLDVARRLRTRVPRGSVVRRCPADASRLLQLWDGCARVVVIDAARAGGPPGTIHRFEAHRGPIPASAARASSHSWGVVEAVELARALGRLPARVVVYAIEGERFDPGAALSPAVRQAIPLVAARVLEDLAGDG